MENVTFEKIQEANKMIRSITIHGKEYATVEQRIKAFRSVYPTGSITTRIEKLEDGVCVISATVCAINDAAGQHILLGTGTACEKESGSQINKTSYIENCETSAVGRALGMCGFGIDTALASADEVENAINQQENIKKSVSKSGKCRKQFLKTCASYKINAEKYLEKRGFNSDNPPKEADFEKAVKDILESEKD